MPSGGCNKLSISIVKSRIYNKHIDNVTIDETTYKGPRKPARFIDCDYGEWWVQPRSVFKGARHPSFFLKKKEAQSIVLAILDFGCFSIDDDHHMIYGYIDETDELVPRIFYVGQGSIARVKNFNRNSKHTATKRKLGIKRKIVFKTQLNLEINAWETQSIKNLNLYTTNFKFDGIDIGCNLTPEGGSRRGSKASAETKALISKRVKERVLDPSYIQNLSDAQKRRYQDPEQRRLTGLRSKGHVCSEEERIKHSDAAKKQWQNELSRNKLQNALRNKKRRSTKR